MGHQINTSEDPCASEPTVDGTASNREDPKTFPSKVRLEFEMEWENIPGPQTVG